MRMSLRLPISSSPTWERLREIEQFWHLRLPTKVVVPLSNTVQWSTQYPLSTILSTPCYVNIQLFCQYSTISCYNNIHPILPCFPGSGTVCLFEQAHCHQTSLSLRKSHYSCYCTITLPLLHCWHCLNKLIAPDTPIFVFSVAVFATKFLSFYNYYWNILYPGHKPLLMSPME